MSTCYHCAFNNKTNDTSCPACKGTNSLTGAYYKCHLCDGEGIEYQYPARKGTSKTCHICNGLGASLTNVEKCIFCFGMGILFEMVISGRSVRCCICNGLGGIVIGGQQLQLQPQIQQPIMQQPQPQIKQQPQAQIQQPIMQQPLPSKIATPCNITIMHPHPLTKSVQIKECSTCDNKNKPGYHCTFCNDFDMCQECFTIVMAKPPNPSVHSEHPLKVQECSGGGNCDLCNEHYYQKTRFFCKECNFVVCLLCYFSGEGSPQPLSEGAIITPANTSINLLHPHPLTPATKLKECFTCNRKNTNGYNCSYCYKMSVCNDCYTIASTRYPKVPSIHTAHPLEIKKMESWTCDFCKASLDKKMIFVCEKCDFGPCLKCFYSEKESPEQQAFKPPENISLVHQHAIFPSSIYYCKTCNVDIKVGYKCSSCSEFSICDKCLKMINAGKPKPSLHPHALESRTNGLWNCAVCKVQHTHKWAMRCIKCSYDCCMKCYFS